MCGILGYAGGLDATRVLVDGLKKLEYRGYDSAGVAVLTPHGIEIRRSVGKLSELENLLLQKPLSGRLGVGHTRWATHGAPTERNAHPHTDGSGKIVVVHNGIIENHMPLKEKLIADGCEFKSQTDTEVVGHLIAISFKKRLAECSAHDTSNLFVQAALAALKDIKGTFALGIIHADVPDVVVGARRDCPLIVGLGDGENFLASDVPAILSHTRRVVFLEEGDVVVCIAYKKQVSF